ncbi:hypothetical protein X798_02278 [Onchocerca flexuosa]|uniref:Uncharacterized protein n=1 Tax=Onchocerca flexuosa TaxID=387005 RepID=A0A238BZA0_9BILA|nr:hypothetical protein X798_02278 [Onchocerca flexuosa]
MLLVMVLAPNVLPNHQRLIITLCHTQFRASKLKYITVTSKLLFKKSDHCANPSECKLNGILRKLCDSNQVEMEKRRNKFEFIRFGRR